MVLGAGCSVEPPTSLPITKDCSNTAHDELVEDGILDEDDCSNPDDLSELADVVKDKTGNQTELVRRLPKREFENCDPNRGHLISVALILERKINYILTLNYDLSLRHANRDLKNGQKIPVIQGPENLAELGDRGIVHLHRSANAEPEEWILTTDDLEQIDDWREVISRKAIGETVTIFAGLGSTVEILINSTQEINNIIPDQSEVYIVDIIDKEDSAYFNSLGLPEDNYQQMSWCDFAKEIEKYTVKQQQEELREKCNSIASDENWDTENINEIITILSEKGLINLGFIRGAWLQENRYFPWHEITVDWIAQLILGIDLLLQKTGFDIDFEKDGVIVFFDEDKTIRNLIVMHGRGKRWSQIELEIEEKIKDKPTPRLPSDIIYTGVSGGDPDDISCPDNISRGNQTSDVISGWQPSYYNFNNLRHNPDKISEVMK
jgi:hypothetical protein